MNKVHQKQKNENSDKLHLFKQIIFLHPVRAFNCQIWRETSSKHHIDTKKPFSDRLPKLQFSAQNSDTSVTDFQNSAGAQAQLLRSLERDYPDSSLPTESSGNHLQSSELFIKHK